MSDRPHQIIHVKGDALLLNPLLNKGTAFTNKEREAFDLFGLIPPEESTIVQQRARSYQAFKKKQTPLEQYMYLRDLQDSNETLYYSLLCEHITEIMPVVYTPVVGEACQNFSHIYRRPRGLFIAYPYKDKIEQLLANPRFDAVEAIVVSDGERILGLGDQGAGGMGIPIGKLALYCACSGLYPGKTLPILLDTGTNNPELIKDPLYIGWRHERIRGEAYDAFIEAFIIALKKRFPHVLLQWEDFALDNATRLLAKYRDRLCTFNDDIQGTAAIAVATLLATYHVTHIPISELRIVIVGAGSAGCGIAELIIQTMMSHGLSEIEARRKIFMVDKQGLLTDDMSDLKSFQKPLATSKSTLSSWTSHSKPISLKDVITQVKPHALLGVSGQPQLFTEDIIKTMHAYAKKPIILPLSNPRTHSEATPEQIMQWTHGEAVIGTGSPFNDIMKNGRPFRVDQTNNVYIFPGMGLGLIAVKATRVTDKMFMVAAEALSACSPAIQDPTANLLPPLTEVRTVSYKVAFAVAKEAVQSGFAPYLTEEDIHTVLNNYIWEPCYVPYEYKR